MGGDLLYRWGNPQAYDAGSADDQTLFLQHDAQWIRPGLPGWASRVQTVRLLKKLATFRKNHMVIECQADMYGTFFAESAMLTSISVQKGNAYVYRQGCVYAVRNRHRQLQR